MEPLEIQLNAYIIVCCGIGMCFGAFGGFPGMWAPGFFIADLHIRGIGVTLIGLAMFGYGVAKGRA